MCRAVQREPHHVFHSNATIYKRSALAYIICARRSNIQTYIECKSIVSIHIFGSPSLHVKAPARTNITHSTHRCSSPLCIHKSNHLIQRARIQYETLTCRANGASQSMDTVCLRCSQYLQAQIQRIVRRLHLRHIRHSLLAMAIGMLSVFDAATTIYLAASSTHLV